MAGRKGWEWLWLSTERRSRQLYMKTRYGRFDPPLGRLESERVNDEVAGRICVWHNRGHEHRRRAAPQDETPLSALDRRRLADLQNSSAADEWMVREQLRRGVQVGGLDHGPAVERPVGETVLCTIG